MERWWKFVRDFLDHHLLGVVVVVGVHRRRDRIDWNSYCFVHQNRNSFWNNCVCCVVVVMVNITEWVGIERYKIF